MSQNIDLGAGQKRGKLAQVATVESKNLMSYCHGSPGYLQICKEGLRYDNLTSLLPSKPYFDSVDVHACEITKGQAGKTFCIKLAQTLNAPVAGATALQTNAGPWKIYYWEDDSEYDGKFYMHSPTGKVTGPFTSDSPPIVHPSLY
jgi:hypothetical protein